MNALFQRSLARILGTLALLALMPIGTAGAQGAEPPPPAVPFDAVDMPVTENAIMHLLGTPPIGTSFAMGANRLTAMQAWDGGWGWPLTPPTNPTHSPLNTLGPIAQGLAMAQGRTGDEDHDLALQAAADYLETKTNNFSPSDGYLARTLDENLGTGTYYRDFVNAHFYGPLAAGTYNRNGLGTLYNTAGYVNLIRSSRSGSQANLAAWDLGMGLVGAIASGVDDANKAIWVQGVEAEVNELDGAGYYDVLGLAGAIYGLAEAEDQSFDPTSGEHVLAKNLQGLGVILAGYQLPSGGWTWNSLYQVPEDGNETIQETAYAILALRRLNEDNFLANMIWGGEYLYGTQLGTGGWENYPSDGENNEVTGEALWGLATAWRGNIIWVCPAGDCGHPEMSFNTIQAAVDAAEWDGTVYVLAGTYPESVTIPKNVHLIGEGPGESIIQAPATLPAASQQGSAILIINGGNNVEVTGFTVAGPGPSGCGSIRYGIFVRDGAHANIHDNLISDIRDNAVPLSGCQNGVAIGVGRQAWSTTGEADIIDNTIVTYQKGGIVVDNAGSYALIQGNTITGIGTTDITAQNGIQISRGADGTIAGDNIVTGNSYYKASDPTWSWQATGVLLYQPGSVDFTDASTFSNNDLNLYTDGAGDFALGSAVFGGSSAPAGIGMDIWNDGTAAIDATGASFTGALTCPEIENRVHHALDDPAVGRVTWVSGELCVTTDTAGIQAGIDASLAGDNIYVYPGTYDETASNRTILAGTPSEQGPYQFGLFFPISKPGISVIGVDALGAPFTDADEPNLPYVTTHATNNFGPSNFFVEGADVTIQGLRQGPNAEGENKSVEVVGDGFTLRYFKSELPDGGGAVYINDWLYDALTETSTVESFTIDQSSFDDGTQVAVTSGAGVSGDVSGRVITGNSFNFDPLLDATWPGVSFNGIVPAVGWFVDPVGGAVITGNSFSGSTGYIRSRGTVEESDFDWTSYWNDNTFDGQAMAVLSATPPLQPRAYSYGVFTNVKIIGANIQPEIGHAAAGDTVLVGEGTYPERVTLDKPLRLLGAGATFAGPPAATSTTIDASALGGAASCGNVVNITGLTGDTSVEGFNMLTGDYNSGIRFAGGTDAGGHIFIRDNHITGTNNSLCTPNTYQYGVIGGYMDVRSVSITGNEISDTYDNSILAELQMGPTEIDANTFNGGFPSVFYMTYDGQDVAGAQKVTDNTFDMSAAGAGSGAAGVSVNPSTYYVTADRRSGRYADFEISGNTFTGIADVSIKAISVGENSLDGSSGGFDSLQIMGNTISGTDGKGIQFFGHVTGATVINNAITGLYQGLKMFSYESGFWPEANDISCNQVSGASDKLVYWTGSGVFNAEYNWWGSAAGPTPSLMSPNVDYTPWLLVPTCGGGITRTISGDAGIAGAVLSYDDGGPQTVVADVNGDYSFTVPTGWSGTVTPVLPHYFFVPASRSYVGLAADALAQDYLAVPYVQFAPDPDANVCLRPYIVVDLILSDLTRTGGAFDLSTVTFTLDNSSVLNLAGINLPSTAPHSRAHFVYRPPSDLSPGPHTVEFMHPEVSGPVYDTWNFTAANITCTTPTLLSAPVVESPAVTGATRTALHGGESAPAHELPAQSTQGSTSSDQARTQNDPAATLSQPGATAILEHGPAAINIRRLGMPHPGLYRVLGGSR